MDGDELTQLADEVGGDWTEHAGGLYRDGHARVAGGQFAVVALLSTYSLRRGLQRRERGQSGPLQSRRMCLYIPVASHARHITPLFPSPRNA